MFSEYHRAIVDAQFDKLRQSATEAHWANITVERRDALVYAIIDVAAPAPYRYVSRIDMRRYPVDPFSIGFIDGDLPKERWDSVTGADARYWPWSPMPGLHGSFVLTFNGPYRTFWCRECTVEYFYYHGDQRWTPAAWPLSRVVSHLREAISRAEPPVRWRPIEQQAIIAVAAQRGIAIPADAGLGNK